MGAQVAEGLRALRAALNESKGGYVLGEHLSYADITLASIVRSICPPHQPRKCAALPPGTPGPPWRPHPQQRSIQLTFCHIHNYAQMMRPAPRHSRMVVCHWG